MPALKNPKHEAFVQLLLQGESAIDAHERVGYRRDDGNSARLKASPKVQERLAELQNAVAEKTQVTVESLVNELEEPGSAPTASTNYPQSLRPSARRHGSAA
jgi:hypothetical protein